MFEISVTINAPALAEAMAALAAALQSNPISPPQIGVGPTTAPTVPAAQPSAPAAPPVTPPGVPVTAAPAFTHEQLMNAGATLIDSGKINELMGLLNAFGVQAVTQLKQEQLGAFATEMRKLGAQICRDYALPRRGGN